MDRFSLKENFSRHKFDLFTKHRTCLLFFLLSAVVDAVSTTYFMRRVGPEVEINAYIRMLSRTYGFVWGPLLGKLYQLFALWGFSILTPRLTRGVCLVVIAINFAAALINQVIFG